MFSKKKSIKTKSAVTRCLQFQSLEMRLTMASSVGWDGPGLGSAQLTYNIAGNPSSLTRAETTAAIEKALAVWSSVANIQFTPTTQRGLRDSLDISFGRIDGAGRTLAQAYLPDDVNPARIAGDIRFDTSETWEVGNARGNRAFDLVWVAVHEIGHALGLDHSNVAGSVLASTASPSQQFVALHATDVTAIQRLYAKPTSVNSSVNTAASTISTNGSNFVSTNVPAMNGDVYQHFGQSFRHRFGPVVPVVDRLFAEFSSNSTDDNSSNSSEEAETCLGKMSSFGGAIADSFFAKLGTRRVL